MDPYEFRRLAEKCFGKDWKREIARHYNMSIRAIGYWCEGTVNVRYDVEDDLREWSAEGGHRKMLVARALREMTTTDADTSRCFMDYQALLHAVKLELRKLSASMASEHDRDDRQREMTAYEEACVDALIHEREARWIDRMGL